MIETFRNQPPAADKRIAQNQRGIVPNKSIAHGRGVACQHREEDDWDGEILLHGENELDRINRMGV